MVRDGAATRSNTGTDQGTLRSAQQSAYHGASNGGSDHDLGPGMVSMVMRSLRGNCPLVPLRIRLRCTRKWNSQNGAKGKTRDDSANIHDKSSIRLTGQMHGERRPPT
jgi:hypothetical protein